MQKMPLTNNMLAVMKIKHELPPGPPMSNVHSRYVHVIVSGGRIPKVFPDWMMPDFEWREWPSSDMNLQILPTYPLWTRISIAPSHAFVEGNR